MIKKKFAQINLGFSLEQNINRIMLAVDKFNGSVWYQYFPRVSDGLYGETLKFNSEKELRACLDKLLPTFISLHKRQSQMGIKDLSFSILVGAGDEKYGVNVHVDPITVFTIG